MRSSLTPSEAVLWARIRGRQLGVVFRRQVPLLGRFIADFLAPTERLVVEVDGGWCVSWQSARRLHAEQARADARRDAVLARAGYRVVRLDAALVMRDIEVAVAFVQRGRRRGTAAEQPKTPNIPECARLYDCCTQLDPERAAGCARIQLAGWCAVLSGGLKQSCARLPGTTDADALDAAACDEFLHGGYCPKTW